MLTGIGTGEVHIVAYVDKVWQVARRWKDRSYSIAYIGVRTGCAVCASVTESNLKVGQSGVEGYFLPEGHISPTHNAHESFRNEKHNKRE